MDHLPSAGRVAGHRLDRRESRQEAAGAAPQGSGLAAAGARRPPPSGHDPGEHDTGRSRRTTRRQAQGPTGRTSPSPRDPASPGSRLGGLCARDVAPRIAHRATAADIGARHTASNCRRSRGQDGTAGARSPGPTGPVKTRARTQARRAARRVEDRIRPGPPRARTRQVRQARHEVALNRDRPSPEASGPGRRTHRPRAPAEDCSVSRDPRHTGGAARSADLGALVDARTPKGRLRSRQMAARSRHGYTRRPCRHRPPPIHLRQMSSPPAKGG